jgi:hypothetical protein
VRRTHVAIVAGGVAEALQRGVKRIETRFYRQRRLPFGRISTGDTVHFKRCGGNVFASAQVLSVKEVSGLTPAAVDRLRRTYRVAVCASAGYWFARRRARYGVLIWLGPLRRPTIGVRVPRQYGSGWLVLHAR